MELFFESSRTKILLGDSEELGSYVIKILNSEYPTKNQIKQFYNEFYVLEGIDLPSVRRAFKSGKENGSHSLVLEYVEGVTLEKWFSEARSLEEKLHLSKDIAIALSELHSSNIIHRDISSTNILIEAESRIIKIIDFGFASKFKTKIQHLGNPEHLQGTLPYISPEQSGRMNRQVDYRTDLYSLGVLMYEIFTNQLPFRMEDPIELVHAHLAVEPEAPISIYKNIPTVVSDIILTLMAKDAESRYESALGLAQDLDRCLDQLSKEGKCEAFQIRTNDFSERFIIHQKLYGRSDEIAVLNNTFEKTCLGHKNLILVAGYSGTGKSSLARELHKSVAKKKGLFLEGKFGQFQRGLPYFAIIQAFESLVNIYLSEEQEVLQEIKDRIQVAVGDEGKVLTDIIPSLELVIGKQPNVVEVGGTETQNRFNYIFSRFLRAVVSEESPLVILIDDLQWSDSGSLNLLSYLITDIDIKYFMCICAYRDNEVNASHPFVRMVDDLKSHGIQIPEIILDNLSLENVNDLISDSISLERGITMPLAELVHKRTGGNAFFVSQFLKNLHEEELLQFDRTEKKWAWDIEKISGLNLGEDVVKLMAGKIVRLPESSQEALKLGACVGASFDLNILSDIGENSLKQSELSLQPALQEGLVQARHNKYKFAHDRIQQAAYSLIAEEERAPVHYRIGHLMMQQLTDPDSDESLFDVVTQLNLGSNMIQEVSEKLDLIRLNLKAGIKSKEAGAFEPSLKFLRDGIELLEPDSWVANYDLTLNLYAEASELAFLCSEFEEMDIYISLVDKNGKEILDKVKSLETRIYALRAENKLLDSLKEGLNLLDDLGEKLPRKPGPLAVVGDLLKTLLALKGKSDDDIVSLPIATNPYKLAAMRICANIAPSAYWGNPDVFPFIIWRLLRLSLEYGNSPPSSFGYATHGVIMVGVFNRFKTGNRFGQLGLKVIDKLKAKQWVAQVYTSAYALIAIWNEHIENTLKPLKESYHIGLETGAIEFGCINANMYSIAIYYLGWPLQKVEEEIRLYSESFTSYKQGQNRKFNEIYRQSTLNLMGIANNLTELTGDAYDEEELIKENKEHNDRTGTFFYHLHKLMLYYHFEDFDKGWEISKGAREILDAVLAKIEASHFHYYEALTAVAILLNRNGSELSGHKKTLNKNIRKLKTWAKSSPMNYLHKYELLQAEKARLYKKYDKAIKYYEAAITGAIENRYLNDLSLIYRRMAKFYKEQTNKELESFYLNKAYRTLLDWEASGVADFLLSNHPGQIISSRGNSISVVGLSQSLSSGLAVDQVIDMSTILKASNFISQEIILSKLLQKMMSLLNENLGATRGCLILNDQDELKIGIVTDQDGKSEHILEDLSMKGSNLVPEKLIVYIQRTREKQVFENIQDQDSFKLDPYVISEKPLSTIAYPIINQGNLTGILYFENRLASSAFTNDRIELLKMLSGQISTSLENALLYENLENKVRARTSELEEEKKKSDTLLLNILPERTAEELKQNGFAQPKRFEQISVMFTDFKDFTKISAQLSPEELVHLVDRYFKEFDRVIEKHDIEKIKTIGDAYMCAAGLNGQANHAMQMLSAALEIQTYMKEEEQRSIAEGETFFKMRIGIHSGPAVAGVVGYKKFAYDIWGDTVNVAARMESKCEPSQINVSGSTYEQISNSFECVYRGKIDVKNKGKIDMYYVSKKITSN